MSPGRFSLPLNIRYESAPILWRCFWGSTTNFDRNLCHERTFHALQNEQPKQYLAKNVNLTIEQGPMRQYVRTWTSRNNQAYIFNIGKVCSDGQRNRSYNRFPANWRRSKVNDDYNYLVTWNKQWWNHCDWKILNPRLSTNEPGYWIPGDAQQEWCENWF